MKKLRFLSFAVGFVILAACGGGGGSDPTGSGLTLDQLLAQAMAQMNRMLADQDPVNVANLNSTNQKFGQARQMAPTNRKANGGYTITAVALEAQRVIDLFGITITRAPEDQTRLEAKLSNARFGLLAALTPEIKVEDALPITPNGMWVVGDLPAVRSNSREYPVSPTYEQVYSRLLSSDAVLANVQTVLENEAGLPTDADPLVVVDPRTPSKTVKLGLVEMRALRAAVQSLRSAISLLVAYNFGFDVAGYPYDDAFAQAFAGLLDDRAIPPSTYLPGGNFGKLYPDGQQRLSNFRTLFIKAVDSSFSAITAYQARTGIGFAVNPGDVTSTEIADYRSKANDAKRYATGTVSTTVSGFATTVNVPGWVANPPASLVALAPPIHATLPSQANLTVGWQGNELPNRTFGGLFSPALPASQFGTGVVRNPQERVYKVLGDLLSHNGGGGSIGH